MTDTKTTQAPTAAETMEAMAEVPATLREMTERGIDQAKTAYDRMKNSAQETVSALDGSADALKSGSTEINVKAIEYAQANINAGFEFARKLAGAKDVKELVELQSAFARDRFAAYSEQARDLSEMTAKLAERTSRPLADNVKKSFDQAREMFPAA